MRTAALVSTRRVLAAASLGLATLSAGCANGPQGAFTGAGLGAAGGAIIGSLFGGAGEGAAIGAVAGSLGGAVIGDQNARRERRQHSAYQSDIYGPPASTHEYEERSRRHDDCAYCDAYGKRSSPSVFSTWSFHFGSGYDGYRYGYGYDRRYSKYDHRDKRYGHRHRRDRPRYRPNYCPYD